MFVKAVVPSVFGIYLNFLKKWSYVSVTAKKPQVESHR